VRAEKGTKLIDFPLGTIECLAQEYGVAFTIIAEALLDTYVILFSFRRRKGS